jgi:RNA polymerase sigma factor (sigma-70 family)
MNKCRADFRKRASVAAVLDETAEFAPVASGPSPAEAAVAAETATLVAAAVAGLPPGQRTVVVLRIWNGLSYGEIAEILDHSEATVRSHMFHGLAAMRKYLEPRLK